MTNSNGNRITPGGNDAENVLRKIKKQLCELEKMLKEADLEQPPKPFDYGGDEAALLNKLSESEKNRRNDLIIWKHYSKTGGIYDMLTDLETAVKKPAVNAFDFDEDENTYIIFITVNNSILSHLKTLWGKMEKELAADMDGNIKKEAENLTELFKLLKQSHEEALTEKVLWNNSFLKYKEEYVQLVSENPGKPAKNKGSFNKPNLLTVATFFNKFGVCENKQILSGINPAQQKKEELLRRVTVLRKDVEAKINKYRCNRDKYFDAIDKFKRKQENLCSYVPGYLPLHGLIENMCLAVSEGGELYSLTVAPAYEDGIAVYMQKAEALCKKAAEITKKYSL